MLRAHFARSAAYNRWANERLYAAAAELSDAEYRADRGVFFKSVHGTLNHVLVADRIWLARLTGERDFVQPALDATLFETLAALRNARQREDERLVRYVEALDESALAGDLTYRRGNGEVFTEPLAGVLAHVFNHQTHHRGQAHAALTNLGRRAPELDLLLFLRQR